MTTPTYRILADRVDITRTLAAHLLSMRISDSAGMESDSIEIELDDHESIIELPRTGATLDVSLGYAGGSASLSASFMVDEIESSGPPQTLTLRGRAADLRQGLKATKTKSWNDTTLGAIVSTIATENGYEPRISAELAAIKIEHEDQTGESDMHFVTRLARRYDATTKPVSGKLVFVTRGSGKSASGQALPVLTLTREEITSWRASLPERGRYKSVTATYHDKGRASQMSVTVGEGVPTLTLRHTYASKATAIKAAKGRLTAISRGQATLSLTLPGRPELSAEGQIRMTGIRPGVDGLWSITEVSHTLNHQGYVMQIEAEVPGTEEGAASGAGREVIRLSETEVEALALIEGDL